ncbi:hypothetical protein K439DRAFT_1511136 [Ramaria rubella]|nr:hypothetical protein K439DRAFT_1511136 [Ramaria rubella]
MEQDRGEMIEKKLGEVAGGREWTNSLQVDSTDTERTSMAIQLENGIVARVPGPATAAQHSRRKTNEATFQAVGGIVVTAKSHEPMLHAAGGWERVKVKVQWPMHCKAGTGVNLANARPKGIVQAWPALYDIPPPGQTHWGWGPMSGRLLPPSFCTPAPPPPAAAPAPAPATKQEPDAEHANAHSTPRPASQPRLTPHPFAATTKPTLEPHPQLQPSPLDNAHTCIRTSILHPPSLVIPATAAEGPKAGEDDGQMYDVMLRVKVHNQDRSPQEDVGVGEDEGDGVEKGGGDAVPNEGA